ncbi:hypothetical protein A2U01_0095061, partial [Trifolium medium]|nr:hypothetical protein [Trifolium medium]
MQAMANNPQPTENNGNASGPSLGLPANYTPPEADNSSQPQPIPIPTGPDGNASHAAEDVHL